MVYRRTISYESLLGIAKLHPLPKGSLFKGLYEPWTVNLPSFSYGIIVVSFIMKHDGMELHGSIILRSKKRIDDILISLSLCWLISDSLLSVIRSIGCWIIQHCPIERNRWDLYRTILGNPTLCWAYGAQQRIFVHLD